MATFKYLVTVTVPRFPVPYEDELTGDIETALTDANPETLYYTADNGDEKEREITQWDVEIFMGEDEDI